jgi:hypothetical protein
VITPGIIVLAVQHVALPLPPATRPSPAPSHTPTCQAPLLVLDASSLRYGAASSDPTSDAPGVLASPVECRQLCELVPGCNAYSHCPQAGGCGSGCAAYVADNPPGGCDVGLPCCIALQSTHVDVIPQQE